uniref:Uncharacterized protein n=1 Tax=Oryza brachyantha TaxID=4533 RepID=J3MUJ6_ORYBR
MAYISRVACPPRLSEVTLFIPQNSSFLPYSRRPTRIALSNTVIKISCAFIASSLLSYVNTYIILLT